MTPAAPAADRLLEQLRAHPAGERAALLAQAGAPAELFRELGEHVERLAVSDVGAALEAGALLVELADSAGDTLARRMQRARAQALAYSGRFDEALAAYERAADLAREAGAPVDVARAQMSSVHALGSLGRYDDALAAGEAARAAFAAAGEWAYAARADANLGTARLARGDGAAALRHFDRARPLLADNPVAQAQVDSNRGRALLSLDDFAAAETACRAALPQFEAAQVSWAAAIVEGNLAGLCGRQGRLEQALHHFERALRHLEQDDSPADLARVRAERAETLATLGLPHDALAEYETALPALQQHGFAEEAARARAGLGRALLRLRRLPEAEATLAEAADELEQLGHTAAQARVNLMRAELAAARGDFDTARDLADAALRTLAERPAEAAAARFQLAYAARAAGETGEAEAHLAQAIADAEKLRITPLLADLHHLRGRMRAASGRAAAALPDLRMGVELVERLRGTLQAERFRAAFLGERLALYDDLLRALLSEGRGTWEEAFQVAERAKGRALLDLVSGALDPASGAAADTPAVAAVLAIRGELSALYSRLADAQFQEGATGDERYRESIEERERRLEALEGRLAAAEGLGGLYAPAVDAGAARALTPPGTALVDYHAIGDELIAFVLTHDQLEVCRGLANMSALGEDVQRLHFQLRRALRPGAAEGARGARLVDDARRELAGLYRQLIAPLQRQIRGATRLLIVPHGPLHTVPFAALWDGTRHLVEHCEIITAPSASLLAAQRRRSGDAGAASGALVVGVADAQAPEIADEARQIAAALGAVELHGAAATADAFLAQAAQAALIHVAGHGYFSPEHPLGSGIKLADRWLTARELYGLRLPARLVTLSGCETGRNVVGAADELVGLVRGFFVAGVRALLVSLWSVHDAATARLMLAFYSNWAAGRAGVSAGAALRAAQLEVLQAHPHPALWSPFVLVGDV